jgi:hypothetical protein
MLGHLLLWLEGSSMRLDTFLMIFWLILLWYGVTLCYSWAVLLWLWVLVVELRSHLSNKRFLILSESTEHAVYSLWSCWAFGKIR